MKKRIFIITLTVILLLCNTFAVAEEFLFQEIPWGTNYPEVKRMTFGEDKCWYTYNQYETVGNILGTDNVDLESGDLGMSVSPDVDLTVAGYDVRNVFMFFAYVPVDGLLAREDEDTALYMVSCAIDSDDVEKTFNNIKNDFIAMYGEPAENREDSSIEKGTNTYIYWYGDNHTVICLKAKNEAGWAWDIYDSDVVIFYATKEGDDWLRIAEENNKADKNH